MKPSKYQQDVFQVQVTTDKNILISAAPGSGKTTTIVQASRLIPYGKSAIFVAFNKWIVEDLKERLPSTVICSTMHSIGAKAVYAHYPGEVKMMGDKKQINLFIEPQYEKEEDMRKKWSSIYQIDRLLSLARATMAEPKREEIEKVIENYALDLDDEQIEKGIRAFINLRRYDNDPDKYNMAIDFQDMISLPAMKKEIRMPQFDYVFVDECQDLSSLDHVFINRLKKEKGGRLIAVGDKKQSIYGFRGSAPDSFDKISQMPNTIVLPLSISYRCAKNIVKEARNVYPDIEEYEHNPDGEVRIGQIEDIREGDMVLCRNVRPLIEVFFKLIEMDKKAYVVGREMEKGLRNMLKGINSDADSEVSLRILQENMDIFEKSLRSRGISNPKSHPRMISQIEKHEILKLLFSRFGTVSQVETFIETVFDDNDRSGVRLMTIHKSKGLENDRVFIIERFEGKKLIPSKYAVTAEQKIQESNLRFVSITRAKKELIKLHL